MVSIDASSFHLDRSALQRLNEALKANPGLSVDFFPRGPGEAVDAWIIWPKVDESAVRAVEWLVSHFLPSIEIHLIGPCSDNNAWRFYVLNRQNRRPRIPNLSFQGSHHPATAELMEEEWRSQDVSRARNRYALLWLREFREIWVAAVEQARAVPHQDLHCDNPDSDLMMLTFTQ